MAQCQVAALAFGLSYSGVYNHRFSPKGCFLRNETGDEAVYFNPDTTGGLDAGSQPLCTTTTTAAPTTAVPTTAAPMTPSPSFRGPYRDIPIPEIPIPASATSEIDHHHKHRHHDAYTLHAHTALTRHLHLRAHVLARADAFYCPHG